MVTLALWMESCSAIRDYNPGFGSGLKTTIGEWEKLIPRLAALDAQCDQLPAWEELWTKVLNSDALVKFTPKTTEQWAEFRKCEEERLSDDSSEKLLAAVRTKNAVAALGLAAAPKPKLISVLAELNTASARGRESTLKDLTEVLCQQGETLQSAKPQESDDEDDGVAEAVSALQDITMAWHGALTNQSPMQLRQVLACFKCAQRSRTLACSICTSRSPRTQLMSPSMLPNCSVSTWITWR